jgi:hypothetical protein
MTWHGSTPLSACKDALEGECTRGRPRPPGAALHRAPARRRRAHRALPDRVRGAQRPAPVGPQALTAGRARGARGAGSLPDREPRHRGPARALSIRLSAGHARPVPRARTASPRARRRCEDRRKGRAARGAHHRVDALVCAARRTAPAGAGRGVRLERGGTLGSARRERGPARVRPAVDRLRVLPRRSPGGLRRAGRGRGVLQALACGLPAPAPRPGGHADAEPQPPRGCLGAARGAGVGAGRRSARPRAGRASSVTSRRRTPWAMPIPAGSRSPEP